MSDTDSDHNSALITELNHVKQHRSFLQTQISNKFFVPFKGNSSSTFNSIVLYLTINHNCSELSMINNYEYEHLENLYSMNAPDQIPPIKCQLELYIASGPDLFLNVLMDQKLFFLPQYHLVLHFLLTNGVNHPNIRQKTSRFIKMVTTPRILETFHPNEAYAILTRDGYAYITQSYSYFSYDGEILRSFNAKDFAQTNDFKHFVYFTVSLVQDVFTIHNMSCYTFYVNGKVVHSNESEMVEKFGALVIFVVNAMAEKKHPIFAFVILPNPFHDGFEFSIVDSYPGITMYHFPGVKYSEAYGPKETPVNPPIRINELEQDARRTVYIMNDSVLPATNVFGTKLTNDTDCQS